MARQVHTPVVAQGGFGAYGIGTVSGTWVAADIAFGEEVAFTGNELILAHNTDAGAHTVDVTPVVNERNRVGTIISAYSVAAGKVAVFGPFPLRGWRQAGGKLWWQATDATVKFCVIKLPG